MTDRVFQILKRRAMIAKDRYVFWSRWRKDQPIGSVRRRIRRRSVARGSKNTFVSTISGTRLRHGR